MISRWLVAKVGLLTLAGLWLAPSSLAAEYYVGKTNCSSGGAGTLSQPRCSIGAGVSLLSPGDTLYVRGGTYHETVAIGQSGRAGAPITIDNYQNEQVVVDGAYTKPGGTYAPLVKLSGSYVVVRDIEVTRSTGEGVEITGSHSQIVNVFAHHNMEAGAILKGDYSVADGCRIWYNSMHNEKGVQRPAGGGWGTGISAARHPKYATIRNCVSWHNWGEGISTFEAEYTTLEDNVSYDNWSANVYLSDTTNSVLRRNLVYRTPNNPVTGYSGSEFGILLGDEVSNPASNNNLVINNLVVGTNRAFYAYQSQRNLLVANNTFANSHKTGAVQLSGGSNFVFSNNIVLQEDGLPTVTGSQSGVSFVNNLWSKGAPGSSDLTGNPQLTKTGTLSPGQLAGQWFALSPSSPARDRGTSVGQVTDDYFGRARPVGGAPDIGGHEWAGGIPPGKTPIPTVLPTPTPTNWASPTPTPTPPPTGGPTPTATPTLPPVGGSTPTPPPAGGATPTPTPTPIPSPVYKTGDANRDQRVDEGDYRIWWGNYQLKVRGAERGDFDESGVVDGVDYVIWLTKYE